MDMSSVNICPPKTDKSWQVSPHVLLFHRVSMHHVLDSKASASHPTLFVQIIARDWMLQTMPGLLMSSVMILRLFCLKRIVWYPQVTLHRCTLCNTLIIGQATEPRMLPGQLNITSATLVKTWPHCWECDRTGGWHGGDWVRNCTSRQ